MDEQAALERTTESLDLYKRAEVRRYRTRTCDVAYRRLGDGPAVIFTHGWPLTSFTFRRLLPHLTTHFTCLLVDVPGGGDTEWTKETDFSWPGQAQTLKELVDGLGLASYFLFGQDSGAMIGRELARIDPRLQKLIMTNTEIPGHRPAWIPMYRFFMFIPGTNLIMRLLLRSKLFVRSRLGFGNSFFDLARIDSDFCEHIIAPLIHSHHRMVGHNKFLRGWDWDLLDRMPETTHTEIAQPVMMIWGEDDPTFPIERAEQMVAQFPNARLRRVAHAKLFVHEDQPIEVSRLVVEFLTA